VLDYSVQIQLALRASGPLLIVLLGVMLIALSLVSMWKENRQGRAPQRNYLVCPGRRGLLRSYPSRRTRLEGEIVGESL